MDLPPLPDAYSDGELAVILGSAAAVLQREGLVAIAGAAFLAGHLMCATGSALHRSMEALLGTGALPPDHRAFITARHTLASLAQRITWEEPRFRSYWSALGRLLTDEERAKSPWHFPAPPAPVQAPPAAVSESPVQASANEGVSSNQAEGSSKTAAKPIGPAVKEKRRFLVAEYTYEIGYIGCVWAVGCLARESALRSFDRRVARNLLDSGKPGAVIVFDRELRELLQWTDGIANPKQFAAYWFGVYPPSA